ncbi:TERF1-interacting nuclear factor 2, partial [Arapaima gigas]
MERRRAVEKNKAEEAVPLSSLRLLAPPLRLVSAAVWQAMQRRDVLHYGKVVEFVTSVSETVPDLLSQRHKAKLILGLQARLVLELCRGQAPPDPHVVLPHLEQIQNPITPGQRKHRKDAKVEKSVLNFHELVKTLLNDPAQRERFFQEVFSVEYGPQFDKALEKLLWEFLTRLDQLLPVPDLAQTVSWLSSSPAVLEECAQCVTQPQLLRSLLQHQKCLGHLDVPGKLSPTFGDSILLSMSLPPSGRVHSPEMLTDTSSQFTDSSTKTLMLSNNKKGADPGSTIQPAAEQIKHMDLAEAVSDNRKPSSAQRTVRGLDEESGSVVSSLCDHEVKLQSTANCNKIGKEEDRIGKKKGEEKILKKKQKGFKRKRQEDDDNDGNYEDNDRNIITGDDENPHKENPSCTVLKGQQQKRGKPYQASIPQQQQQLGEEELSSLIEHCLSHQPKVVIPRLHLPDVSIPVLSLPYLPADRFCREALPEKKNKRSPECKAQLVTQRQNLRSDTVTPNKQLLQSFDKENCANSPLSLSASPVIPPWGQSRGKAAMAPEESEDIVFDSEDESTKNFKGRAIVCETVLQDKAQHLHPHTQGVLETQPFYEPHPQM